MGDDDPLTKAEALLSRYRTGAESGPLHVDFPVLTEIVEPSPPSAKNALQPEEETKSHELELPQKLESDNLAALPPTRSGVEADFTHDLAKDLAARIRPVIDEFTDRMAFEIAAAVRQEISRVLSEGIPSQSAGKAEEHQEPAKPTAA